MPDDERLVGSEVEATEISFTAGGEITDRRVRLQSQGVDTSKQR